MTPLTHDSCAGSTHHVQPWCPPVYVLMSAGAHWPATTPFVIALCGFCPCSESACTTATSRAPSMLVALAVLCLCAGDCCWPATTPFQTAPCGFCLALKALVPPIHVAFAVLLCTGDCRWPATTPFTTALCGFCPAPLVSLRTLKADVIAGGALGVCLGFRV